ncbi:hypothetical protein [Bacillus sp. FJAT-27225]|uniref:hypothetical protein n=1 Tax=Bacillus sp. FJAT-27225 TaxID=1743144 RepID=UPI0009822907|nr:hypothetical protein [Bacillus sp. FJAT-27225]
MKVYVALVLQFMVWSGYTLTEWLSKHDHPLYNFLMFLIFLNLGLTICNKIVSSWRKTIFVTVFSLGLYAAFHFTMSTLR